MRSKIVSLKVWLLISVLISRVYKSGASIVCPKSIRSEKGSEVTLKCNITGSDVSAIYWYKGKIPRGNPILQLKNSRDGGVEHDNGHYSIKNDGGMVIKKVKLEHEGFYSILVENKRMHSVGDEIELKITVPPKPPWPQILLCSSCQDCKLSVGGNGNLTCEMNEIRPMIPIEWKIRSLQDVNITLYSQIATHDTSSDSWNVSVTLSYMALSCNSSVRVHCQAEDDRQLLKYPVVSASLEFDKSNCSDQWTNWTFPSSLIELITVTVPSVLVVLAVVLSRFKKYIYKFFPGLSKGRYNKMSPKRYSSFSSKLGLSSDEEEEPEKKEMTVPTSSNDDKKEVLYSHKNSQEQRKHTKETPNTAPFFSSDEDDSESSSKSKKSKKQKTQKRQQRKHTKETPNTAPIFSSNEDDSESSSKSKKSKKQKTQKRQVKTRKKPSKQHTKPDSTA